MTEPHENTDAQGGSRALPHQLCAGDTAISQGELQRRFDALVCSGRGSTPEAFAIGRLLVSAMTDEVEA